MLYLCYFSLINSVLPYPREGSFDVGTYSGFMTEIVKKR